MAGFAALAAELDAWQNAGKSATLWLRDDDAALVMPELERLLALSGALNVPLCLAAIPMAASPALARALARRPTVAVAVHGHAHRNHAAPGEKKAELGPARPVGEMVRELESGLARMGRMFGTLLRPVLVPPWNRIAAELVLALPAIGFRGLSTFGARQSAHPAAGLLQVNSHVEAINWKAGGVAAAPGAIFAGLAGHLRARRLGEADGAEPTGLLTHHKIMKENDFFALQRILAAISAHPAARWLTLDEAFPGP